MNKELYNLGFKYGKKIAYKILYLFSDKIEIDKNKFLNDIKTLEQTLRPIVKILHIDIINKYIDKYSEEEIWKEYENGFLNGVETIYDKFKNINDLKNERLQYYVDYCCELYQKKYNDIIKNYPIPISDEQINKVAFIESLKIIEIIYNECFSYVPFPIWFEDLLVKAKDLILIEMVENNDFDNIFENNNNKLNATENILTKENFIEEQKMNEVAKWFQEQFNKYENNKGEENDE